MSTYLVCFAVHKFEYLERTSASGIPVSLPLCVFTYIKVLMKRFELNYNIRFVL